MPRLQPRKEDKNETRCIKTTLIHLSSIRNGLDRLHSLRFIYASRNDAVVRLYGTFGYSGFFLVHDNHRLVVWLVASLYNRLSEQ